MAVVLDWIADKNHDAVRGAIAFAWPSGAPAWAIPLLLAALGLFTYFIHRTATHPLVLCAIRKTKGKTWPSDVDLLFDRASRRGAPEHSEARSVQSSLDVMNASIHFLYCSTLSALLLAAALCAVPEASWQPQPWWWAAVFVPAILAIIGDVRASDYDVQAKNRSLRRSV
jgi:hypothetical protein